MSIGRRPALDAGGCRFESYHSDQKINGDAATTAVLRQTVNLFRKVNIVGSNPTGTTKINTQVAQLAEATDLESVQCEFESHFGYHILNII